MEMIYYGGIGKSYAMPEKIDFHAEVVLSYEIKKLNGWKSANLVIVFINRTFEQPIALIVNYDDVINYLKKLTNKKNKYGTTNEKRRYTKTNKYVKKSETTKRGT
jgi:hypothetical protein